MTYSMTEDEAQGLVHEINQRPGWHAEVLWDTGYRTTTRCCDVCVRGPSRLLTLDTLAARVRGAFDEQGTRFTLHSRGEYARLLCPDQPDYAERVAEEALARLPSGTRIEWLGLADGSTLYCWRSYRGHHYDHSEELTGAATVKLLTRVAGQRETQSKHLRPGWTDAQFKAAIVRLVAPHIARPEWQEIVRIVTDASAKEQVAVEGAG